MWREEHIPVSGPSYNACMAWAEWISLATSTISARFESTPLAVVVERYLEGGNQEIGWYIQSHWKVALGI